MALPGTWIQALLEHVAIALRIPQGTALSVPVGIGREGGFVVSPNHVAPAHRASASTPFALYPLQGTRRGAGRHALRRTRRGEGGAHPGCTRRGARRGEGGAHPGCTRRDEGGIFDRPPPLTFGAILA